MRAEELFIGAGGEALQLVPGLNAHPRWVKACVELINDLIGSGDSRVALPVLSNPIPIEVSPISTQ